MSNASSIGYLFLVLSELTWSWRSVCAPVSIVELISAYFSERVEWYHSNGWEDVNAVCQCIYVFIYRLLLLDMYIGDTISLLAA